MVTNIDNYNNANLFGCIELSSIYAPSRLYLWGIVTGSCTTGNDVTGSDRKLHHRKSLTGTGNAREIFLPLFSRISRVFSHRNFSRFYVRKIELWIQHVSGHYCAITPFSYAKPFFESMTYYGSYRNTCLNR